MQCEVPLLSAVLWEVQGIALICAVMQVGKAASKGGSVADKAGSVADKAGSAAKDIKGKNPFGESGCQTQVTGSPAVVHLPVHASLACGAGQACMTSALAQA